MRLPGPRHVCYVLYRHISSSYRLLPPPEYLGHLASPRMGRLSGSVNPVKNYSPHTCTGGKVPREGTGSGRVYTKQAHQPETRTKQIHSSALLNGDEFQPSNDPKTQKYLGIVLYINGTTELMEASKSGKTQT